MTTLYIAEEKALRKYFFNYIAVVSAPIHPFLKFLLSHFSTEYSPKATDCFPIVDIIDIVYQSTERILAEPGIKQVGTPVLKSGTLPNEQHGL